MIIEKTRTPVFFEFIGDRDDRFRKVKIKIAHTGENLNNTYFSKEALLQMATTLSGVPIVGFIEANNDGDRDFSDHRQNIVIKDGDVDIEYSGHAYGFIPEENNAQIEIIGGKEWLTCEGYLWTKFKAVMDIFNEANGFKSQSMEIQDIQGYCDDIGRMVIETGVFSALCILGEHVSPAMTGSTVQLYSKNKAYEKELDEMLSEFSSNEDKDLKKKKKGGDDEDMTVEKEKPEVVEPEVEEKDLVESGEQSKVDEDNEKEEAELSSIGEPEVTITDGESESEDLTSEENEVTENEVTEDPGTEDTDAEDTDTEDETSEDDTSEDDSDSDSYSANKKVVLKYELAHGDIRLKLYNALVEKMGDDRSVWIMAVYDDNVVFSTEDYSKNEESFFRAGYEKSDESIKLGEVEIVKPMFLTLKEAEQIESQREEIKALEARISELGEYKETIESGKKDEILNEYASDLTKDEIESLKMKSTEMSVSEFEKEIAYQLFQKGKNNKVEASRATNFSSVNSTTGRYGTLDAYFKK